MQQVKLHYLVIKGLVVGVGACGAAGEIMKLTQAFRNTKMAWICTSTNLTNAYVQSVGRAAYVWGWALVNNANRHALYTAQKYRVIR
jgi:hypothetical protein